MSGKASCSRAGMAAMLRTASSLKSSITGTIAQCWFALLPHELRCPQVVMTVQQPIAQCSSQSSCSTHTLSGTGSHAACADPARTALVGIALVAQLHTASPATCTMPATWNSREVSRNSSRKVGCGICDWSL
jgi:hypothetical protein